MSALRTTMCAIAVLVAVAWFARVPAPPPGPDDAPEPAPDAKPPDAPIAGSPLVDMARLLAVQPLDAASLRPLTASPVALTAGPVTPVDVGHGSVLVGTEPLPRHHDVQVVRVSPVGKPLAWDTSNMPVGSENQWMAVGPTAMAWSREGGRVIVDITDVPWITTRLLPDGHEVLEGGFTGEEMLTVVTARPGSADKIGVMVWDLRTGGVTLHTITRTVRRSAEERATRTRVIARRDGPRWVTAMDSQTRFVHLLDVRARELTSIDGRTGDHHRMRLPDPSAHSRLHALVDVVAGDGLLVLHERPSSLPPTLGTMVLTQEHELIAHDADLRLHEAALGEGGSLLARDEADRIVLLDEDLRASAVTVAGGALPRPDLRGQVLGVNGRTGYVLTASEADEPRLLAIDLVDGEVTATRSTAPDAVFVPEGPLLLTPVT